MSASREKKARQELNESGYVDPRKAREAKEKAKERRSTRIYTAVIVAFVLLGVVLLLLSKPKELPLLAKVL